MDPLGETNSILLDIKSRFTSTSYTGSVEGGEIVLQG